jgi:outer membrane protein TolC
VKIRAFVIGLIATGAASAQSLTLPEAVSRALRNYAGVEVSQAQVATAAQGIQLARTAYLPRTDFYGQLNRGTRNNIFGMLLPNTVIWPISGPPRPENDMTSVWGSAVGFLVQWEPFDFGLRKANVEVAESATRRAEATQRKTELEVAAIAADAYLTVLAAQATVVGAQAGVDRAKAFESVTDALAKAELRPGADASRARAERAVAEAQLIQSQEAVAVAEAALRQFAGEANRLESLKRPPGLEPEAAAVEHPAIAEQSAAIAESQARQKALQESYVPKFNVQGVGYARGSGANADGSILGGANGLGPNIFNYGVGLSVSFPALDIKTIRVRMAEEAAREKTEAAKQRKLQQDLNGERERAEARLTAARKIAETTPVQLEAARAAEQQATARYKAGLATIAEVADAQRLLTQAETDDLLAQLAIWRNLLRVAAAKGDLAPFLESVK